MKYVDEFRDKDILKKLSQAIKKEVPRQKRYSFMEVCGTHTMNIFRFGLKSLLPDNVRLISGPGCPVCVTPVASVDRILAYSELKDVIIVTFGDMVKVPGSRECLFDEKAKGAEVKVVYSPEDAIKIAEKRPDKKIVLIGVGFETTAPLFAQTVLEAKAKRIKNLFLLSLHKTMPEPLLALLMNKDVKIDGFILPAHVSTIIGSEPYKFIPKKFGVRCIIAGFEPVDVMQGILGLVKQKVPRVDIQYSRVVKPGGNPVARGIMEKVFEKCDSEWRGLGVIKQSGLKIKNEFKDFDVEKNIKIKMKNAKSPTACICGEVLKGKKIPTDCRLFGKVCTPLKPAGACMVSSEGTCAAYYKYGRK